MSLRSYRGNRGKSLYEVSNFTKGMNNTNASINNGQVKELVNFRISPDGMSLRPREPFINYNLFYRDQTGEIHLANLSNEIGVFTSKQYPSKEFIIDLKGQRPEKKIIIYYDDFNKIRVIDGDTIEYEGQRYRFLLIDAPEINTLEGISAKDALEDILFESEDPRDRPQIELIFDPWAPSWVDAFGRHLVWVFIKSSDNTGGTNINKWLVDESHANFLDEEITKHKYLPIEWTLGGLTINPKPNYFPTIWVRDLNKSPKLLKTNESTNKFEIYNEEPDGNLYRPTFEIEHFQNIYLGALTNDLDIGYSTAIEIVPNKIESEYTHFKTTYNPFIVNEMPNYDGMVMLGSIGDLYKGLISFDLEIPLTEDQTKPDFENPKIIVNTYNHNVRKVNFEDLSKHSQNLLDQRSIELINYKGQNAIDEGYNYPMIRSILFKREEKFYTQLQRNRVYKIEPLVALPSFDLDVNGYDPDIYKGYAYKWEIIIHNKLTTDRFDEEGNPIESIKTLEWNNDSITNIVVKKTEDIRISDFAYQTTIQYNILYRDVNFRNIVVPSNKLKISWPGTPSGGQGSLYDGIVFYNSSNVIVGSLNNTNGLESGTNYYNIPSGATKFKIDVTGYYGYSGGKPESTIISIEQKIRNIYITQYDTSITLGEFEFLYTDNPIFKESTDAIQVRLHITPYKEMTFNVDTQEYEWSEPELVEMDLNSTILTSAYMPFTTEEIEMPSLHNTSNIRDAQFMTFYEDQLILYGGNIAYLSDFSNLSYFPFKYALDQIPEEIIHIHPFKDVMIVFTKSDVWAIEKYETETESGSIITDYYAKKILQNVFIDIHLKNTIRTVGKYIMVMLEDKIILLKPNSFTGDNTDLTFIELQAPIGDIVKDPNQFVKDRLRFYNIFIKDNLYFDLATEVDNKDFKIILSTFIEEYNLPYMLELCFDGSRGLWYLNDTISTAYPIFFSKGLIYYKSHPTLTGGVTLTEINGVNKYKVLDPKRAHVDIHNFVYDMETITTRPDGILTTPINLMVDLGYMNISNHLVKRFVEARMDITNINTPLINMAYSFRVDNKQRQSTYEVYLQIKDGYMIDDEVISFENLSVDRNIDYEDLDEVNRIQFFNAEEISLTQFNDVDGSFQLDLSKFPTANKLDLRIPVNGRGRIPRLIMAFETTNDFEIFKFIIIYKEQTGRMVSQR